MRILVISSNIYTTPPAGYGGLEQITYEVAVGLQRKGHEVAMVSPTGSALPPEVRHIATIQGEPEENTWKGNTVFQKAVMEEGYDVIWDSSWESWPYMGSKGRDPQLPLLHTFHAYPHVWGSVPLWVRHVGAVGLSNDHADHVHEVLGVPTKVAYNGADTEFYQPDPAVKRNGRYLWLGRYSPEKGPDLAIQIAKEAKVNLTLVGDTQFPPDKAYIQRCFEASDGLWIKALPAVARADAVKFYQGHKALLYPLGWREPFSLVLVEAALCGLPVVVLDRGAAREVVQDGVTGFVCKNIDEMREVVRTDRVKEIDPEACRAWGLRFSTQAMVDRYETLFQEFVKEPW